MQLQPPQQQQRYSNQNNPNKNKMKLVSFDDPHGTNGNYLFSLGTLNADPGTVSVEAPNPSLTTGIRFGIFLKNPLILSKELDPIRQLKAGSASLLPLSTLRWPVGAKRITIAFSKPPGRVFMTSDNDCSAEASYQRPYCVPLHLVIKVPNGVVINAIYGSSIVNMQTLTTGLGIQSPASLSRHTSSSSIASNDSSISCQLPMTNGAVGNNVVSRGRGKRHRHTANGSRSPDLVPGGVNAGNSVQRATRPGEHNIHPSSPPPVAQVQPRPRVVQPPEIVASSEICSLDNSVCRLLPECCICFNERCTMVFNRCGHLICVMCYTRMIDNDDNNSTFLQCPMCKGFSMPIQVEPFIPEGTNRWVCLCRRKCIFCATGEINTLSSSCGHAFACRQCVDQNDYNNNRKHGREPVKCPVESCQKDVKFIELRIETANA